MWIGITQTRQVYNVFAAFAMLCVVAVCAPVHAAGLSCSVIHSQDVSNRDIDTAIQQLAEMRMELDLRISAGESGPFIMRMEREFNKKLVELSRDQSIEKIQQRLIEKIQLLQSKKNNVDELTRNDRNNKKKEIQIEMKSNPSLVKAGLNKIKHVRIVESDQIMIIESDKKLLAIDLKKENSEIIFELNRTYEDYVSYSADNKTFSFTKWDSSTNNSELKIFRIESGQIHQVAALKENDSYFNLPKLSADGRVFAYFDSSNTVKIFDLRSSTSVPVKRINSEFPIQELSISFDGFQIAFGTKSKTEIHNLFNENYEKVETEPDRILFSKNEKILSIYSDNKTFKVLDFSKQNFATLIDGYFPLRDASVQYSMDNQYIYLVGSNSIVQFERINNQYIQKNRFDSNSIKFNDYIKVSEDNNYVITSSLLGTTVFYLGNGQIKEIASVVSSRNVGFSDITKDGKYVAIANEKEVTVFETIHDQVNELGKIVLDSLHAVSLFSNDGQLLYVSGVDGKLLKIPIKAFLQNREINASEF